MKGVGVAVCVTLVKLFSPLLLLLMKLIWSSNNVICIVKILDF